MTKLAAEVLDWAVGVSPEFTVTVLEAESQVIDALEQRGFINQPGVNSYQSRSLDALPRDGAVPEPRLPRVRQDTYLHLGSRRVQHNRV